MTEPPKLADLFPPDRVLLLRAGDKSGALNGLARRAASATQLPAGAIVTALASREGLGSTGVGDGIAVPHARLSGLAAPVALFARLERPVDWTAIDGKPVDLVFLLLSPADADAAHLAALAAATRRLRETGVASAIRAGADRDAIRAALIGGSA